MLVDNFLDYLQNSFIRCSLKAIEFENNLYSFSSLSDDFYKEAFEAWQNYKKEMEEKKRMKNFEETNQGKKVLEDKIRKEEIKVQKEEKKSGKKETKKKPNKNQENKKSPSLDYRISNKATLKDMNEIDLYHKLHPETQGNLNSKDELYIEENKNNEENEYDIAMREEGFSENDKQSKTENIKVKKNLWDSIKGKIQGFTGNKLITEEDILPVLEETKKHLINKNVALEIAEGITKNAKINLLSQKTESFTSINTTVKTAITESIKTILSSQKDINILKIANDARSNGVPLKIVFCGINGVGKSTTLAKVAFYLQKEV